MMKYKRLKTLELERDRGRDPKMIHVLYVVSLKPKLNGINSSNIDLFNSNIFACGHSKKFAKSDH